uniref:F-box/LRR-repeat protein At1g67190-like isoform X1 n=1 Tax=Rhizophora mucronata TaxID=61149 RepID=A0A2P2JJL5_RHIMU
MLLIHYPYFSRWGGGSLSLWLSLLLFLHLSLRLDSGFSRLIHCSCIKKSSLFSFCGYLTFLFACLCYLRSMDTLLVIDVSFLAFDVFVFV